MIESDERLTALMFVVGLMAVTLWLAVRYIAVLDAEVHALKLEFYRPPREVVNIDLGAEA